MLRTSRTEQPATVGEHGLALFRPIPERRAFEFYTDLQTALLREKLLGKVVMRGNGFEAPPSASIAELAELRGNPCFETVNREEAVNEIYQRVGSLQRSRIAPVVGVAMLGRGIQNVVAIELDRPGLAEERFGAIETLRELAGYDDQASVGMNQHWTPHISLLKIGPTVGSKEKNQLYELISNLAPDSIRLKQVKFHKP